MITRKETLECDLLIAGGGIGGLQAAIDAANAGLNVIVAEKANTRRSGSGATGNDHFMCYIPEVHGTLEDYWKLLQYAQEFKGGKDRDYVYAYLKESYGVVLDWESYGIPMRPHGDWEFTGHKRPGVQGMYLKYEGVHQKPLLTKAALKAGAKIMNRMPYTDLILNDKGEVIGAVCVDLNGKEPAVQLVRAKAVIISTAGSTLMNGSTTMGWMFNLIGCPACTGVSTASAYRAGARLVCLDGAVAATGASGCKFFNRGGKATWVGLLTDIDGNPSGPFLEKPDWQCGDVTMDIFPQVFRMNNEKGVPIFMNCSEDTDFDLDYMIWALRHEGNGATLSHLKDEGFDFRKHMVEFDYKKGGGGGKGVGIDANADTSTTVPGLFSVGVSSGNGMVGSGPAACTGRVAAKTVAEYVKGREFEDIEDNEVVNKSIELFNTLLSNPVDTSTPTWNEAILAVQQTMWDYMGSGIRSEALFRTGLEHMARLEKKLKTLHCANNHEFMRCLEAINTLETAKLCMTSSRSRKETRGAHKRADYPFTDPKYDGMLVTLQQIDGEPVSGMRPMHK